MTSVTSQAATLTVTSAPAPLSLTTQGENALTVGGEPDPPSGLTVTPISSSGIDLVWIDNSVTETGFVIERSITGSSGPFTTLASVSADTTSFSNTGLLADLPYWYRIQAVNGTGGSSFTTVQSASTPSFSGPKQEFTFIALPDTQNYAELFPGHVYRPNPMGGGQQSTHEYRLCHPTGGLRAKRKYYQ